jgi:hypothetical protein
MITDSTIQTKHAFINQIQLTVDMLREQLQNSSAI